jgi:hypothetical protein
VTVVVTGREALWKRDEGERRGDRVMGWGLDRGVGGKGEAGRLTRVTKLVQKSICTMPMPPSSISTRKTGMSMFSMRQAHKLPYMHIHTHMHK